MRYFSLLVLLSSSATAAELQHQWLGEMQLQREWQDFNTNAANNPDNLIFEFHDSADRVELRPELMIFANELNVNLKPRARYRRNTFSGGKHNTDSDLSLRYWNIEYLRDNYWFKAGRYVNNWGPARLLSPSNRYHSDAGQTDPNTELLAREYVEAGAYLGSQWQLLATLNYDEGGQDIPEFHTTGDLRATWQSTAVSATFLLSKLEEGMAVGGYGQWTFNDALILYTDLLYQNKGQTLRDALQSPTLKPDTSLLSSVVGLSYTFSNSLNVVVDYYRNEAGFNEAESRAFMQLNRRYTASILQQQAGPEQIALVRGISSVPFYQFSRDYLIAMLQLNNLRDDIDLSYIHVQNLVDNSTQHTLNAEYRLFDKLTFYGGVTFLDGEEDSEFGRFVDRRAQVGIKAYF